MAKGAPGATTAVIRAGFGGALNPASFTASSVIVVQVTIDNTTGAAVTVTNVQTWTTDFTYGGSASLIMASQPRIRWMRARVRCSETACCHERYDASLK